MLKILYIKFAPVIAPFLLLTTIVLFCMCVWRGEVILGLQAELIKDKNQEIKVVVEQHEAATKISGEYEQKKAERIQEKEVITREIEKIITVPSYSNFCFDDAGLHQINNAIASVNSTIQPETSMSSNTGAN